MDFNPKFSPIEKKWLASAKKLHKTIVLPEASFSPRILKAGLYCAQNNIADIVLLTDKDGAFKKYNLSDYPNVKVVNYVTHEIKDLLANALYVKRKEKGVTLEGAFDLLKSPIYFATMMVELGLVDGSVCGAECASKDTFKPAFQIIKGKNAKQVSSFFIMLPTAKNEYAKPYLLSDCAINLNPDANLLADIAVESALSYKTLLGDEPKVALLSYSTKGSGNGEEVDKIKQSIEILNQQSLDFLYDGELQLDCAVDISVANLKNPKGKIKGDANVLIFPDLQSGNIGYKIMQRFGGYKAIGPIVQGLNKPINDVSRGATEEEIILTIAFTCIQK